MPCPTRRTTGLLVLLLALGLAACEPQASQPTQLPLPTTATPVAVAEAPTHTADVPSRTQPTPPSQALSPTPATLVTPTPPGFPPLRRQAVWGDGVPVAMALTPDGTGLIIATTTNLQRHDATDLARTAWRQPQRKWPTALALTRDGTLLAVAAGSQVELRQAEDGALVESLPQTAPVADVAVTDDGTLLAVATGEQIVLWELGDRTVRRIFRLPRGDDSLIFPGQLTSVAFAPGGDQVAAGDLNGNVAVWRVAGNATPLLLSVGPRVVADVTFSPDGATLVAASEGWRAEPGAVWAWEAATGVKTGRLAIADEQLQLERVERVAFTPDGRGIVAGTAQGDVLRWRWPEGRLDQAIEAHRAAVSALVPGLDGELFTAGRDGKVRRWDHDGVRQDELDGLGAIGAVAAPSSELLVTGGEDGTIALWRRSGALQSGFVAHRGQVNALAVSPDGALLASAGDDGGVRLWALPDGAAVGELEGHVGPVLALAFAPDGKRLASAGQDGTVRLWTLPEGTAARELVVIPDDGLSATSVLGIAFDARGTTVTGTAYDGELRRYAVADGQTLASRRTGVGGWLVAVVTWPGGAAAALDDSGRLWVWNAAGVLAGRGAIADATALVALGDRGLLTTGPGGDLRLWFVTPKGLVELTTATATGGEVAVTPDGTLAIVGSRRGIVELWTIPPAPQLPHGAVGAGGL